MNYSDLRIGMLFSLKSEDYPHEETQGRVVELGRTLNNSIYVQFNDTLGTYAQGHELEILPKCLFYIGV